MWRRKEVPFYVILGVIATWLLIGLLPQLIVLANIGKPGAITKDVIEISGSIGDGFGAVNSLFSALALAFVIWNLFIQSHQSVEADRRHSENIESINRQIALMKDSATLTSISHIYDHYGDEYSKFDRVGLSAGVARGHRRWAIRESFSIIDPVLEQHRVAQVRAELNELLSLVRNESKIQEELVHISELLGSLLLDKRLSPEERRMLWPFYEFVRSHPTKVYESGSANHRELLAIREQLLAACSAKG